MPDCDPVKPVMKGDRLYGRGSSDDGYAPFAFLAALRACMAQKVKIPHMVMILEGGEESGSPGIEEYLEMMAKKIKPDIMLCCDSGV